MTFAVSVFGMIGLLWLGSRHVGGLRKLLEGVRKVVAHLAGFFGRKSPLPADWAAQQSADFKTTAAAITQHPYRLLRVTAVSLLMHITLIIVLAAVFLAFNQPLNWVSILTGYAMSVLFTNVSPTPNGVGIVELTVPPILKSLGMAAAPAVGIILAFRLFTFWLPVCLGFVATRNLQQNLPAYA